MKMAGRKRLMAMAAAAAGLLFMGAAGAWWYGDPWYRPYGAGAMTYERQTDMRHHGLDMRDLSSMFNGERSFDREEAVRLARDLERGFGDEMIGNFAPGAVVAGSSVAPWTWRNFGAFRGYNRAAQQAAASLAGALEAEPTAQDVRQTGVWIPGRRMNYGRFGHLDGLISMDAIRDYSRLNATCHSCHTLFRGWRR